MLCGIAKTRRSAVHSLLHTSASRDLCSVEASSRALQTWAGAVGHDISTLAAGALGVLAFASPRTLPSPAIDRSSGDFRSKRSTKHPRPIWNSWPQARTHGYLGKPTSLRLLHIAVRLGLDKVSSNSSPSCLSRLNPTVAVRGYAPHGTRPRVCLGRSPAMPSVTVAV